MKLDAARLFAAALLAACDKAEKDGRDALNKGDIQTFADLDDKARADLDAAILDATKLN